MISAAACSDDDDSAQEEPTDEPTEETTETADGGWRRQPARGGPGARHAELRGQRRRPGFGFVDADGNFSGFDIDFCRAVAAAVLGDPEAVELRRSPPTSASPPCSRARSTCSSETPPGPPAARRRGPAFLDHHLLRRPGDDGAGRRGFEASTTWTNTAICVLSGHHNRAQPGDRFGAATSPTSRSPSPTTSRSRRRSSPGSATAGPPTSRQLAGVRSAFPDAEGGPEALVILDEIFSKEPLGPVVRDGDASGSTWSTGWCSPPSRPRSSGSPRSNVGEHADRATTRDAPRSSARRSWTPRARSRRCSIPVSVSTADFAVEGDRARSATTARSTSATSGRQPARARAGAQHPVERRRPGLLYAPPYR